MIDVEIASRLRVVHEVRKTIDGMRDFPVIPADDDVRRLRGLAVLLRAEALRAESIANKMETP